MLDNLLNKKRVLNGWQLRKILETNATCVRGHARGVASGIAGGARWQCGAAIARGGPLLLQIRVRARIPLALVSRASPAN